MKKLTCAVIMGLCFSSFSAFAADDKDTTTTDTNPKPLSFPKPGPIRV